MITNFEGEPFVPESLGIVANFDGDFDFPDYLPAMGEVANFMGGEVADFMGEIADFRGYDEDEDGDVDFMGAIDDISNDSELMGVVSDFGLSPELFGDIAEMDESEVAEILPELMGGRLRRAFRRMKAKIRAKQARRVARVAKRNPRRAARIQKRINRRRRIGKRFGRIFKKIAAIGMPLPMRIAYLKKISKGRFAKRRAKRRARRQARRAGRSGSAAPESIVKKRSTVETTVIPPGVTTSYPEQDYTRSSYTPTQQVSYQQPAPQQYVAPEPSAQEMQPAQDLSPADKKAGFLGGGMMPIVLIGGAGLFLMKDMLFKRKKK